MHETSSPPAPDWLKPLRNAGWLGLGRAVQVPCSLGAMAIASRILGAEGFGVVVLMHSLMLAIAGLAQFSSWKLISCYGADALHHQDRAGVARVLRFGLMLDGLSTAFVLLVLLLAAAALADLVSLPTSWQPPFRLYGVIAISLTGTNTALGWLRLRGQFRHLAAYTALQPLIRLAGSLYCLMIPAGIGHFLLVWAAASLLSRCVLVAMALRSWQQFASSYEPAPETVAPLIDTRALWRFAMNTHLADTLKLSQSHLPALLVGSVLGPAAAGIFRVAEQLSGVLVKLTRKLFMPALLPELSHLAARGEQEASRVMTARLAVLGGVAGAVIVAVLALAGESLLALIAGPDFAESYAVMMWLATAGLVLALSFPLEPALLSSGKSLCVTTAHLLATLAYLAAFYPATERLGLEGAGITGLLQSLIAGLCLLVCYFTRHRTRPLIKRWQAK